MGYYSDEKNLYLIDGVPFYMTEEDVEEYQDSHPEAEIVAGEIEDLPKALPDEAADDYLDCSCPDDDSRLCKACELYFASLRDLPFE